MKASISVPWSRLSLLTMVWWSYTTTASTATVFQITMAGSASLSQALLKTRLSLWTFTLSFLWIFASCWPSARRKFVSCQLVGCLIKLIIMEVLLLLLVNLLITILFCTAQGTVTLPRSARRLVAFTSTITQLILCFSLVRSWVRIYYFGSLL